MKPVWSQPHDRDLTVQEGVIEAVRATASVAPETAAIRGSVERSYGDLMEDVEQAQKTLSAIAGVDTRLAIESEQSYETLVNILAAWASRVAVVPLDMRLHPQRRRQLIQRVGATAVWDGDCLHATEQASVPSEPDEAYALFTSGSTGDPKGVVVPTSALTKRLLGFKNYFGFDSADCIASLTPLSFDISVAEYALPLLCGGSVALFEPAIRMDPSSLVRAIQKVGVSTVQGTPSYWRWFLRSGGGETLRCRRLWVGGEALHEDLAAALTPLADEVFNMYGPTEAVIWATAWRVDGTTAPRLGDALPSTALRLDVVDRDNGLYELLLGGDALAIGYLEDPQTTACKFISDSTGTRWYRTGDMVSLAPDGGLLFRGRHDDQVKLRGERIELGAIEAAALRTELVSEACVLAMSMENPDSAHLALVAVTSADSGLIRKALHSQLPRTHVPSRIVIKNSLPRNSSGKVDRKALAQEVSGSRQASAHDAH